MPLRVLVVDDSAFMRKIVTQMIEMDPELTVVGTAFDGVNALQRIPELKPDIVTLDVNMPRMDGLTTLQKIMETNPLPVIMLSATTQEGAEITFTALNLGAVDYVPKPSGQISLDIERVRAELVSKIKTAAQAKLVTLAAETQPKISLTQNLTDPIIAIGASTGGPPAVEHVLTNLPKNIPPILIVQHMPAGFTNSFAKRLDRLCSFDVKEAEDGDPILSGQVLVAPGGYHMTVTRRGRIKLDVGPPENGMRPAVDPMMRSVAEIYQSQAIGVVLTGMGRDGAYGLEAIKKYGGRTIAQDEATCTVFGMPRVAIEEGHADVVLPISKIAERLARWC
ncbi:MAG: chemotaxis response regulator protein-glutamate methylesterase [Candidatus Bathyarchaeota archaeon]|nr:chemotaxis response regulator protein-glutamate methylesterase [Candidatus Bathyarchaeota archaeon]